MSQRDVARRVDHSGRRRMDDLTIFTLAWCCTSRRSLWTTQNEWSYNFFTLASRGSLWTSWCCASRGSLWTWCCTSRGSLWTTQNGWFYNFFTLASRGSLWMKQNVWLYNFYTSVMLHVTRITLVLHTNIRMTDHCSISRIFLYDEISVVPTWHTRYF